MRAKANTAFALNKQVYVCKISHTCLSFVCALTNMSSSYKCFELRIKNSLFQLCSKFYFKHVKFLVIRASLPPYLCIIFTKVAMSASLNSNLNLLKRHLLSILLTTLSCSSEVFRASLTIIMCHMRTICANMMTQIVCCSR